MVNIESKKRRKKKIVRQTQLFGGEFKENHAFGVNYTVFTPKYVYTPQLCPRTQVQKNLTETHCWGCFPDTIPSQISKHEGIRESQFRAFKRKCLQAREKGPAERGRKVKGEAKRKEKKKTQIKT